MWKVLATTALLITLTACETPSVKNRPGDGTVIIQMGRIGADKVQYRHLDSVNAVRQARGLSQKMLAEVLNVQQPSIAKMEKRTDMYLSTLRSHIEAMGGELDVIPLMRLWGGELEVN